MLLQGLILVVFQFEIFSKEMLMIFLKTSTNFLKNKKIMLKLPMYYHMSMDNVNPATCSWCWKIWGLGFWHVICVVVMNLHETFVTTYRKGKTKKQKKKLKKIIMTKVKPLLPQCCSCSHSFWKARKEQRFAAGSTGPGWRREYSGKAPGPGWRREYSGKAPGPGWRREYSGKATGPVFQFTAFLQEGEVGR